MQFEETEEQPLEEQRVVSARPAVARPAAVQPAVVERRPAPAVALQTPAPVAEALDAVASTAASEEEVREELRGEQDRLFVLSLLREQENLARMEELRDRQELEAFVTQIEHEKKLKSALRQEELDRLWGRIREQQEEEGRRRRLEELSALRDAEGLRLEIEKLRESLFERRRRRQSAAANVEAAAPQRERAETAGEQLDRQRARVDSEVRGTEMLLMERFEERLESLIHSMESLERGSGRYAAVDVAPELASIPAPAFVPARLVLAGKGLYSLRPFPPTRLATLDRFGPDYDHSTRSLDIVARAPGVWSLLVGNRHGVSELDATTGEVLAHFPMNGGGGRYAVNAALPLDGGGLLATHSEAGALRWDRPGEAPVALLPNVASARNLRAVPTGFVYTSDASIYRVDAGGTRATWLADNGDRLITAIAAAGPLLYLGDGQGCVAPMRFDEPDRALAPLMLGSKIYSLAVLAWNARPWLAAGVKKRTGAYVVLHDLTGQLPERVLNVPERVHRVAMPQQDHLIAASERFLSHWNLAGGRESTVVPVFAAAPVQDVSVLPD